MPIQFFKPELEIGTRCDSCGYQQSVSLASLYGTQALICTRCGAEHTHDRTAFREEIDAVEGFVAKLPDWPGWKNSALARWLDQ